MKPDFSAGMDSRYGWLVTRRIGECPGSALMASTMNLCLWLRTFIITGNDLNRPQNMDRATALLPE
jgi:hypothetical protein